MWILFNPALPTCSKLVSTKEEECKVQFLYLKSSLTTQEIQMPSY